jgi:putative aminopeptidase FrvX
LKNIFLDVGAKSKKEVEEMGIHVGCVITYEDQFMTLNNRYYVGRALDNRIGGFMIADGTNVRITNLGNQLATSTYVIVGSEVAAPETFGNV